MFNFKMIDNHQIPTNDRRRHHLHEGCFCNPIFNEATGNWLHKPRVIPATANELLKDDFLGFGNDDEVVPMREIERQLNKVALEIEKERNAANKIQEGGDHYLTMPIEPWDVIDSWSLDQRVGFYRGNLLKYTMRLGSKDGALTEARKARHYAQKLVEVLEEK